NSLSFVVFTQKQLRTYSTFRYLAYLAIIDLCVLYCGLGHIILRDYFKFDIRTSHLVMCKLHTFLTYITTQLSSWILALVSIDRAVACSLMQKRFCKAQSADRIFVGMCLAVAIINSHILFFMGEKRTIYTLQSTTTSSSILSAVRTTGRYNSTSGQIRSKSLPSFTHYYRQSKQSITTISTVIRKSSSTVTKTFSNSIISGQNLNLIIKANPIINNSSPSQIELGRIIHCTHNTSDFYFKFFEKPYNVIDLFSYVLIPFIIMTICSIIVAYRLFYSLRNTTLKGKTRKTTRRARQISYMLLTLNLVFVLLLAPVVLAQVFQDLHQEYRYRLFNSITLVLSYSNHALNFILYGITSPQFRLTFRHLLGIHSVQYHHNGPPGFYTSTVF
ncbi:unnamed protein product, partial [Didymodactylos carnosus]